jgi:stress-induced morphogen
MKQARIFFAALGLVTLSAAFFTSAQAQEDATGSEAIAAKLVSGPGPTFTVPASDVPANWTLIAYGDMRFTDPTNFDVTNPKARVALVRRIAELKPDAVMLSGDVPYDGANKADYEQYIKETAVWRSQHLRVYPALGNHELHKAEIVEPKNWWATFPELKGRRWYSVQFADSYLIAVDTNLPLTDGSRQQTWLADQLDHLPKGTKFVFLSLHHPPVADGILNNHSHDVRPNELALKSLLTKKAAGMTAKIVVVAGHIHNYERFDDGGVTYLVSGGGGAKPHEIARTAADKFAGVTFPNYHYIVFHIVGDELKATMYRLSDPDAATATWEKKDEFTVKSGK